MRDTRDAGRPRLLYVITSAGVGGAQTHVVQLCERLRAQFDLCVTAGAGSFLPGELGRLGVRFVRNPFLQRPIRAFADLRALLGLRSLVRAWRPAIVHGHTAKAGALVKLLKLDPGAPGFKAVYTPHNWSFNPANRAGSRRVNLAFERASAGLADAVICVSQSEKAIAEQCGVHIGGRVHVVYNGIETPAAAPAAKQPGSRFRFVWVGRLERPKLPEQVVRAFRLLPAAALERMELAIIGDGALREPLAAEAAGLPVRFLGQLGADEVSRELACADALILVSAYESFGLAILEAMSKGLPVICSLQGGTAELVQEGQALIVDSRDLRQIAAAMQALSERAELRDELRSAALARSRQFSLQRMAGEMRAVYASLATTATATGRAR